MIVSLEEVKEYLRVEGTEEDALLEGLIATAQTLCMTLPASQKQRLSTDWILPRKPLCFMLWHISMNIARRRTIMNSS